jgi:hypothetical protein
MGEPDRKDIYIRALEQHVETLKAEIAMLKRQAEMDKMLHQISTQMQADMTAMFARHSLTAKSISQPLHPGSPSGDEQQGHDTPDQGVRGAATPNNFETQESIVNKSPPL